MRIAVPSNGERGMDELVGEHFGRVPAYTIVEDQTKKVDIIPNKSHHTGGRGYPPELLHEKGVDVMVCSSLGRRAIDLFQEKGIRVYVGASGLVRDAIEQWETGKLVEATDKNACERHAFRGSGQGYK
ncbi:MAG: dinitrogenase iron-molybdenum cofactor biosynthesis protein [Candidatus Altiarchaeales archaeon ex4484_2]|nr:MAG: dinitrogenase iron-molybdenum cofactor biosynthesis protein [Candidatus Altiarchaeales archaeon ex4484_2]